MFVLKRIHYTLFCKKLMIAGRTATTKISKRRDDWVVKNDDLTNQNTVNQRSSWPQHWNWSVLLMGFWVSNTMPAKYTKPFNSTSINSLNSEEKHTWVWWECVIISYWCYMQAYSICHNFIQTQITFKSANAIFQKKHKQVKCFNKFIPCATCNPFNSLTTFLID